MNIKRFLALARVSSREQEREGFSLAVQDDALHRYATQNAGEIVRFWNIAETASKRDERKAFKGVIAYAKQHAATLDGVLFFKVDRAARNLFDYVELERLEADHGVPVIYVSQPTENTPAGRMMRRTLANMAAFYTEQQSLDVRDGHARRVAGGLFVGLAPYGYANVRRDGRGLVEVHPDHGRKVRRLFDLYAYHGHTLDSLRDQLANEGIVYTDACPQFPRSKLYSILKDRAYLGEVMYQGNWYAGGHAPLVDLATFQRVQVLLGGQIYRSHESVYGSELVACGYCGHPVTGEVKTKQTKAGLKDYVYYRCSKYTAKDHPRVRVTEADMDAQVLALFDRIKIRDERVRDWFRKVLRARTREGQVKSEQQIAELNRQLAVLRTQQDRLLNLRLLDEIDEGTFAAKNTKLRDRVAALNLQVQGCDRSRAEKGEIAEKAFEFSQTLTERWVSADRRAKRQLLEIVCLNLRLDGVTLVPAIRKPFDVLAEGLLVSSNRGDKI
jgi:DNA invertase Pin-like site-specific DNA recombinase